MSTVSRVISGSARVTEAKAEAVLEAIQRLGYRPNANARSLVKGKSMGIGILTQAVWNAFYQKFLQGVEAELNASEFHPVYVSANWQSDDERDLLKMLIRYPVDALIVVGGFDNDEPLRALAEQLPCLAVGRGIRGLESQCMTFDNERGGYLATKHLIELGHRRIVKLQGQLDRPDALARFEGYKRALREAGLPFDDNLVVEGHYYELGAYRALKALLARQVDFSAIFASNDHMAYGAQLALREQGLGVPEDISIVGFDDLPISAYMNPPLTSVRHLSFELGRSAVQRVIELLEGQTVSLPPLPVDLAVRHSTAPAKGGDP